MKRITLPLARDKWNRNFDRRIFPAAFSRRFHIEEKDVFLGKRRADSFWFYEKKKNRFALLPPCLRASLRQREGRTTLEIRFFRPAFPAVILLLWALLFFVSSLFFIGTEWDLFALLFFVSVLAILPFLWYSEKRKRALLQMLSAVLERPVDLKTKK